MRENARGTASVGAGEKKSEERRDYLNKLSQSQKKKLLKYYQMDYELFGYDFADFLPSSSSQ